MTRSLNNKNNTVRGKVLTIVSCLLTVLCAAEIFKLSSQPAEISAQLSGEALGFFFDLFGDFVSHRVFRKLAHAAEYFALAFLIFNAIYRIFGYARPFFSFSLSFLYSLTDEFHQHFVPGRACRIFDIFVDALGSCGGIVFGIVILLLIRHIIVSGDKKRKIV